MKKLLALLAMFSMVVFIACEDDDDEPEPTFDAPAVSTTASGDIANGSTGETATFNVSVDAELTATWSATSTGDITLASTSGDVSGGSVEVTFDAGTNAGAASITLTVEDSEGQTDDATAVFNILAPGDAPVFINENGAIPSSISLVVGATLAVDGVEVTSDDGVSSVTVTVNGTENAALGASYDGTNTSETYGFSVNTADLGAGSYSIVFTAEDSNGSTASFSHALTVEPTAFFTSVEEDANGNNFLEISGSVNADYELPTEVDGTALDYYVLAGRVKVTTGATLTIPAGSVLKGRSGTGANATALLIAKDATLDAQGSADQPIIFTAFSDEITMTDIDNGDFASPNLGADVQGLWGGVIVLGNAPISASADQVQIEGIPTSDTDGLYGGDAADDNSGTISYISIRHGGSNIGEGNEINGLTLGGVGSATTISNVEVVANQDDGIEWFGGNASIDNILIWNCGDDGLDTDQDWQGSATNFLIVTPQGSGFELDGPEGPDARDGGVHTFDGGTVFAGDQIALLVDWDDNTNAEVKNTYFYGISEGYYPFDDEGEDVYAVASFGGDGNGTTENWEITLEGADTQAGIFNDDDAVAITTTVDANANTVGISSDDNFLWTWPGSEAILSGTLGLD